MKMFGYTKVRSLFKQGLYNDFGQIADDIGRTALAADLGMSINTLRKRTNDPSLWVVRELERFAEVLEVEPIALYTMVAELRKNKKKSRK